MRNDTNTTILALLVAVTSTILVNCSGKKKPERISVGSNPDLRAHSREFRREVIEVTDGVHVAIGYGLANSILLEGQDGVVVVDTMESVEAASQVKAAFAEITKKPIRAVIYTHYHTDHTFGAAAFLGGDKPDIYSHESTNLFLDRIVGVTQETTNRRAARQFGTHLPRGGLINCGIGPFLDFTPDTTIGLVRPTKTFSGERTQIDVAGIKLVLIHAPGETDDQTYVWMPDKKVLLPGDNYYKSFPNLYAIRGTAYRDVMKWVRSLDIIRELQPEYLVPSHTRPLSGADRIYEVVTDYRDAIQFVHDQTIRAINQGLTPEQIVERVKLPAHLAGKPYLHEYYGTVPWAVRAIFTGYLGWFGGNATDLFPLTLQERAKRFAELAGGQEALAARAREAAKKGDHQWALELADQLLQLGPDDPEARQLKAASLKALGEKQIASTARNYYLTQALEMEGAVRIERKRPKEKSFVHGIPLETIFKAMSVRLIPEKSLDADVTVGFRFPDTEEGYTIHVRRGVAEIQSRFPREPDVTFTVNSDVWKEITTRLRNPLAAFAAGDIKVEGGTLDLARFLGMFERY
jgi:alkyl sulfatase BDS1-like metallo-beta-lactamase superfamily hydrolase